MAEARHERAYKLFMSQVFTLDPNGAVLAFARMMRTRIVMPAHLMGLDGDANLFERFSRVAQKAGVYTTADYASIIATLVAEWNVGALRGLSDEAAEAQEYLGGLSERYQRLAERMERSRRAASESFSWIFNRVLPWAS
jgi:acyl-[acyl-carrier-protein] desaturase